MFYFLSIAAIDFRYLLRHFWYCIISGIYLASRTSGVKNLQAEKDFEFSAKATPSRCNTGCERHRRSQIEKVREKEA